jgi:hypothetical protein
MFRSTARRSKPEPFWRDLIDRWKASGQSVAAFCAAHHVSPATLYAWRKRLAAPRSRTVAPSPGFAAVPVIPDPMAEVSLPSGLVVRVPVSTDPATVARLVLALRGAAC